MTELSDGLIPVTAAVPNAVRSSILIVDDVPANLELLASILGEHGYEPRPVPGGRLALAAAKADPPDLIILDINMPEMNGWEVYLKLKADESLKDIPVLFITAVSDTADKVKAFSMGAVDYITKPYQVEEVCARVETHLRLRRLNVELSISLGELQRALKEIRTLHGIIPICSSCKKIRDDEGAWQDVERYVSEHSEAQFSHGICPGCMLKLYPEYCGMPKLKKTEMNPRRPEASPSKE
jgi:CheY-like chemotaxis protein